MVITLIGYRGSGKTTVAGPLAERLGWEWADSDDELEKRDGRTIREIFAADGEDYFRRLERETIAELLRKEHLILAAGGGAILNEDSRNNMRAAGPVVWLQASVDTLYQRIHGDQTTAERRPDLTDTGGRREIEDVLSRRESLYRESASILIQTDERTTDQIVDQIVESAGVSVDEET